MRNKTKPLEWTERGVPISAQFDDPFYSLDDGLEETRHVFLTGNDLPARFSAGFHIAELGFGTGLNLLAALDLWRSTGQSGVLQFTSFEAYPMAAPDMIRAQGMFPDMHSIAQELRAFWEQGTRQIALPDLRFTLITGDARDTVQQIARPVDAWFLDGFSPAKNPELWQPDLLAQVAQYTRPGGTAATYTAAGHVRRALTDAGFVTQRITGYGRKRHMTIARKPLP